MNSEVDTPILILNGPQIDQKIKRMAYEIYENNFKEKSVVLAGICAQGKFLAKKLYAHLEEIAGWTPVVIEIDLDKSHPFRVMDRIDTLDLNVANKVLILVDDVLNTGKTVAYGMKPFLNVKIKKMELAVLIDRSHPAFPIRARYTGYALSTTLSEHVTVNLRGKAKGVYLH